MRWRHKPIEASGNFWVCEGLRRTAGYSLWWLLTHLDLRKLETSNVIGSRSIGRSAEKSCKSLNMRISLAASHRSAGAKEIAFGQQAAQHGLCSQGELWSAVELSTGRLSAPFLRELAGRSQVATSKPYEKFAEMTDRHWDGIRLLSATEQGLAGLRRRPQ